MGLLSGNPGRRHKFIVALKKYGFLISTISYAVGVSWMAALAHEEFSGRSYFSENQLLPGLVETYFMETHYTYKMYNTFQNVYTTRNRSIKEQLATEMNELDLDVYHQDFYIRSKSLNGTNIVGVFRSPRATGVESLVINVPLHGGCGSCGALALLLGLAKYFRKQTYWAKDIIFLITEHDLYGIKAWLEAYYHDDSEDIVTDDLTGHGGSIQAAVILDFASDSVTHIDLLFEGMNGLLPNLDLINLVFRIGSIEGIPVKFKHQTRLYQSNDDYARNLETLVRMMVSHASGYPTGNHGMFFKYRIEAITLRGNRDSHSRRVDFETMGRMIEGIYRSLNNMLEHIHQSFFLYVLPNTHRYISIGLYMPPLGCLMLPLVISLFIMWIEIFQLDQEETAEKKILVSLSSLLSNEIIVQIIFSSVIGALSYQVLIGLLELQQRHSLTDHMLFAIFCMVMCIFVKIIRMLRSNDERHPLVLKLFVLLHAAILIVVLSILNFSAAFLTASCYVPVMILMTAQGGRLLPFLQLITCLLTSPVVLMYGFCVLSSVSFREENNFELILANSFATWKNLIVVDQDNLGLGTWSKNMLCYTIVPIWILSTSLVFS